ncbi:MAG: glycoside hydrolase family 127 protein [Lachnospiraceae bacterium]|nr:glycoside hydrolase family 127 protein [Lachnospiraceae bacterium]
MYADVCDINNIKIDDDFWSAKRELIRKEVIPYQWDILNDRVPEAEPSFCMHNFKAAAALNKKMKDKGSSYEPPKYTFRGFAVFPDKREEAKDDEFYGYVFQDSDFAKWIEAVGYSLSTDPDPDLEKTADEAIDIVCAAQLPNGYLDTYYIINGMDKSFSDLRDNHELYCMGHLIEGAISYYKATGKDKLLNAAKRYADFVSGVFGPEEDKLHGYPGHEIAEMALFRLYEVTGEERYRELAEYFINERGKKPYYFEKEHPDMDGSKDFYHQAHLPVREQSEAVGHAVRAVYLYSGMADMARICDDKELKSACERLWNSIVDTKLYITGAIGATHIGESFSFPYDLPNDTVYAETCASIGLIFFARRMLMLHADRRYSDIMELALYNSVLSGIALDGKSFFYVNPLEVLPEACRKDERKEHVKPVRQKWFGCACCPPNIARLISSIGLYAYTENEHTLFTHLYMGSTVNKNVGGKEVKVTVKASFPNSGTVYITVENASDTDFTLALRIPGWAEDSYKISGLEGLVHEEKDGYLYIKGFSDNTAIEMDFPMTSHAVFADEKVAEDCMKAAIMRGPVVYCLEENDNGPALRMNRLKLPLEISESHTDEFGFDVVTLNVKSVRESLTGSSSSGSSALYKNLDSIKAEEKTLTFIPYCLWANRGEGEMSVYVRV